MIKQKQTGQLIIISGTTCAGKGTVVKELLKRNENLTVSISYTSRPKREGEIDGKDYFFASSEEFEKKAMEELKKAKRHIEKLIQDNTQEWVYSPLGAEM